MELHGRLRMAGLRGTDSAASMGGMNEEQKQVPIRLRSGQAFDSAEVLFAQDDRSFGD
jgi:hypothetical protein